MSLFRVIKILLTSCRGAGGLSCGVRTRGALFYKVFAGSVFLSGSVKWCSGMDHKRYENEYKR